MLSLSNYRKLSLKKLSPYPQFSSHSLPSNNQVLNLNVKVLSFHRSFAEAKKKKDSGKSKERIIDLYNMRKTGNIVPSKPEDIPVWFVKVCRDFLVNNLSPPLNEMSPADGRPFFRKLNVQAIKDRNEGQQKIINEVEEDEESEEGSGEGTDAASAAAAAKDKSAKEKEKEKEKEKAKTKDKEKGKNVEGGGGDEGDTLKKEKKKGAEAEKSAAIHLQAELGKYYKDFLALPPEDRMKIELSPHKRQLWRRELEEKDIYKIFNQVGKKKVYPNCADPERVLARDILRELRGIPEHVWNDPYYPPSLFHIDMDPEDRAWAIEQLDSLRAEVVDPKTGKTKVITIDDLPDDSEKAKNTIITDIFGPEPPPSATPAKPAQKSAKK